MSPSNSVLSGLVISIIAELAVAVVLGLLGYVFRHRITDYIRRLLARALSLGVLQTYVDQKTSRDDIIRCLKKAKKIKILTHRGKSLFDESSSVVRETLMNLPKDSHIQILLGDPYPDLTPGIRHNFAALRGQELQAIDDEDVDVHLNNMRSSIRTAILWAAHGDQRTLRLHNTPTIFRMFLTETDIFVMFYSDDKRAQYRRVYRCPAASELYKSYERNFDFVWEYYAYEPPARYSEFPKPA